MKWTVVSRSCGPVNRLGSSDSARPATAVDVRGMESRLQPVWIFSDGGSGWNPRCVDREGFRRLKPGLRTLRTLFRIGCRSCAMSLSLGGAQEKMKWSVVSWSCGPVNRLGSPDSARPATAVDVRGMESRLQPVWIFNDGPSREFRGVWTGKVSAG